MMQRLVSEHIEIYDLGMMAEYKRRWSDETLELKNLVMVC
jgi:CelD/BcsL family acetyltransferase involved in cellulose biosynthesis